MTSRCVCSGPCSHASEDGLAALARSMFGTTKAEPEQTRQGGNHVPSEGRTPPAPKVDNSDMAEFARDLFDRA